MSRRVVSAIAAAVCALVAGYLAVHARDSERVRDAGRAGAAARYDEALALAESVERAPSRGRALVIRARTLTAKGDFGAADSAWREALRRDPNNWALHFEWARMLIQAGRFDEAARQIRRARQLNPKMHVSPFLAEAP